MKKTSILLLALTALYSCSKSTEEHDLILEIKTPFRTGTIQINSYPSLNVLADSSMSCVFYSTPENKAFNVTINRNNLDSGSGYATLVWKYNDKETTQTLEFTKAVFVQSASYTAK